MSGLYSVKYHDKSNVQELTVAALSKIARKANEITILSAYYSVPFFEKFFSAIPVGYRTRCKVVLVLNGFGGIRLDEQRQELKEVNKLLIKLEYKKVNIFINTKYSLFHTKLYRFRIGKDIHWFIGSANASDAAFTSNEEILFHIDEKTEALGRYLEAVVNDSALYTKIENIKIDSMIKFWRTGLIYYKPNASIQFTFSQLKIPDWVKKELIQNPPRYAAAAEPWGPFNLKLALGYNSEEMENEEGSKRGQSRHTPWAIETCFGYWVPSVYTEQMDEKIEQVSEKKKAFFHDISKKMKSANKKTIQSKFQDYLADIERYLKSIYDSYDWAQNTRIVYRIEDAYFIGRVTKVLGEHIRVKFDDGELRKLKKSDVNIAGMGIERLRKKGIPEDQKNHWLAKEFWRPGQSLRKQFASFVRRLDDRLSDERHVDRACCPFVQATMPEIWTDPVAYDQFSESFFEYVSYRINKPAPPKIIRSIRKRCGIEQGDDWEEVRHKMQDHIRKQGWSETNWLKK